MVIDSSAIVSIFKDEPEGPHFVNAMKAAPARRISVASWVEVHIVTLSRYHEAGLPALDRLWRSLQLEIVPVDLEQGRIAREAFSRFGKGRHPAGLNYGDCFAYALASQLAEPLLCKGNDFPKTDIWIWQAQ